jgi:hypothetical protein
MCLVYEARPATKDVDAVFRPTSEIRLAVSTIAQRHGLPPGWLNDGVKGYLVEHEQKILFDLPNLKVFIPEPDYLLAMKTLSARADTFDQADVRTTDQPIGIKLSGGCFRDRRKILSATTDKTCYPIFYRGTFRKMMTLKQVRHDISLDPLNWQVYLMDFVDEFRRSKHVEMIAEPFEFGHDEKDALLASTAEALCDELGLEVPKWLDQVPACKDPYFVSGLENLKAISIVESPARFRLRKIFVLDNFLTRA